MKDGMGLRERVDGVSFAVRVSPRASRTRFAGVMGAGADAVFKIALAAPPLDGRANEALIAYLADVFSVARSAVEVTAGEHSRNKVVRVKGRSTTQVAEAFKTDKEVELP